MKIRYFFTMVAMVASVSMVAQETYVNADLATEDLNGTARYIGMGGALDALGADISTIGTNPAGIGLFRHSTVCTTFGVVSQKMGAQSTDKSKTSMSFDQVGFVFAGRSSRSSFINFAFNYHKSRNFNSILSAAGKVAEGASQNRVSYNKGSANVTPIFFDNGEYLSDYNNFSQLDYLYYNSLITYADPESFHYYGSESYSMGRTSTGFIGEYDFNISGNINDRIYLGLTMGIHDVHYSSWSTYNECLAINQYNFTEVAIEDSRNIYGTGVDIKFGAIFRPVEDFPLRIGLSLASPVYYELETTNNTKLSLYGKNKSYIGDISLSEGYNFRLETPWTFGLSMGYIIGNKVALGLTYNYADYGSMLSGRSYGEDGYDSGGYDEMNDHISKTLLGVSTLKLGAEYIPVENFSLRLGFNYVSPMYDKNGVKDATIDSYGVFYQSTSDFTNWQDTWRITVGAGYNIDDFRIDLAYQYSQTNGNFLPFYDTLDKENVASTVNLNNKRHQIALTLGYTF